MKNKKKKLAKKKIKRDDWSMNQFVDDVWKTMETQAEQNKSLKMIHAKLEPEWNKIIQKVSDLIDAKNEAETVKMTEEICGFGVKAVRPLIDVILKLKSAILLMEKQEEK